MRRRTGMWLLILLLLPWPARAAEQSFTADLSDHLIAITTGFNGTSVLLFGITPPAGNDVAVVVRGPPANVTVRHKRRLGPIWVDGATVDFKGVPSFYAVASSRPLAELAPAAELDRYKVGTGHLGLDEAAPAGLDPTETTVFRDALLRAKQRAGLYTTTPGRIAFVGDQLFRTRIVFPADVPPGTYKVQVLQFVDGRVAHAQENALEITKVGVEAQLYDVAVHQAALYGLAAILAAVVAGWGAATIFRRG